MYKNYVFDLYGTLIDINTNEWNLYLWKKMQEFYSFNGALYKASELKKEFFRICREEEDKLNVRDYPEIKIEYVFQLLFLNKKIEVDIDLCRTVAQFFRIISTKYIKLYEGVEDFLKELKNKDKKIYLLSNAQQVFTEYEMKHLDIYKYFDGIIFSSDEGCKKPSKDFFEILFKRYNLDKDKTIMIGNDHTSDILGANKVGIDSLYIHSNISPQNVQLENIDAKYIFNHVNYKEISKTILR